MLLAWQVGLAGGLGAAEHVLFALFGLLGDQSLPNPYLIPTLSLPNPYPSLATVIPLFS